MSKGSTAAFAREELAPGGSLGEVVKLMGPSPRVGIRRSIPVLVAAGKAAGGSHGQAVVGG